MNAEKNKIMDETEEDFASVYCRLSSEQQGTLYIVLRAVTEMTEAQRSRVFKDRDSLSSFFDTTTKILSEFGIEPGKIDLINMPEESWYVIKYHIFTRTFKKRKSTLGVA